jgi:KaiC/GvpD/RAD55 family RecA-like ATPase
MLSKTRIASMLATFVTVAVLSFFVLSLFPFYPFAITLGLALLLGLVAIELPGLALLLSVLLSILGATYQSAFIGITFLIILIILSSVVVGWFGLAMVVASWVLAFFAVPTLAILPTVLAGLREDKQEALKVGAVTGLSLFLLSWARNIGQAGLMMVPSPNSYVPKPVPNPWQFQAFLPNADVLATDKLTAYFAPLGSSIGDFRIYALIICWAIAGFLIAILAPKLKGYLSVGASVVGVLPIAIVSVLFAAVSPLQVGIAFVGTVAVALVYGFIQPMVTAPSMATFTNLSGLVTTGIPQKYSLLLGSPACDERNMVVEQFMQSGVDKKFPSFMVTSDASFAQSAVQKFGDTLTVLVANPRATAAGKNIIPLTTGVSNLTSLNIELVRLVKDRAGSGATIVLDVVSEIMLAQKMLMTRKWVSDIVPRLLEWGFTVLGVFNPGLHSNEEVQGLIELFNGYVQISEKEIQGKTRKVIAVRKMADLQYKEGELVIEKEQLGRKKSGVRLRLGR